MDLRPPNAVREITARLEAAGFETWAVGGAVRDAVLGIDGGDWDLATRARPAEVQRLFRRTVPIGVEHGTVGVFGGDGVLYEVTTFRRDVETFGRHAVVAFADAIDEDLARRDFTCNALAWHPVRRELRDPYGGLADLEAGILRTVGEPDERFAEDYLRVLRALRFAGHFQFTVEAGTWSALALAVPHLADLSAERIREELMKVLGKTRRASASLSLYGASGAAEALYPELDAVVGVPSPHAPAGDAWTVSLFAVDAISSARPLLRLAALLHAIGLPAEGDRPGSEGQPDAGARGAQRARTLLRRYRFSNAEVDRVGRLVAALAARLPAAGAAVAGRRWLRQQGVDLANDVLRLHLALARGARAGRRPRRGRAGGQTAVPELLARVRHLRAVLRQHPPLSVSDLAIGGDDLKELGLRPGPRFGAVLRSLIDRVIERPELNTREALLDLVRRELMP